MANEECRKLAEERFDAIIFLKEEQLL